MLGTLTQAQAEAAIKAAEEAERRAAAEMERKRMEEVQRLEREEDRKRRGIKSVTARFKGDVAVSTVPGALYQARAARATLAPPAGTTPA